MTPKRKVYLGMCSEKEKYLRKEIKDYKREIKAIKSALQTESDYGWFLDCLKFRKLWLTMVRHELQRLKGMDRVVVIGDNEPFVNTLTSAEYWTCKCGTGIYGTDNYCSNCGKRILRRR